MSENLKQIIWEKWVDPYGSDIQDFEWPGFNAKQINNDEDNQDESNIDEEDYLDENDQDIVMGAPVYMIPSKIGLIPYNEFSASGKIFNFWVGHTNFDITPDIVNLLDNSDGVEILDIFTRYRFRIAIGKSFKDQYVMNNINLLIKEYFNDSRNN
jgi:hypothetical protein